jgi:asparagine synthase (glutamine-hydrolysing)
MCGITGIISLSKDGTADHEPLDRMIEAMRLRGPDDSGKAVTDRVAFGMRRLSIIDLEYGHQPIESEDGAVRVIMNGELYSFPEVKKELEGVGHRFRTESDTEVLVHGYEEWGIEGLLERLNGMFAFALHDLRNDVVFVARDRLGIKPLVYSVRDGQLYFASSIKALLMTGRIPVEPDPAGVRLYLYNQYIPAPYTIVAGVRKLPPASYMRIDGGKLSDPRVYWRVPDREGSGRGRDWHGELRDLFEDAVRCHMISDVEVGIFLSGGLDSSLVLSYMSEMSPHKVKAFSVSVKHDNVYDESPYARMAAERFGAELIEIPFRPEDAVDAATRYIDHLDEPLSDPAQLPTFILSEHAHRQVKVVLSGEGADELFAGYDYYDRYATMSGRFRMSIEGLRRRVAESSGAAGIVDRIRKHTYRSAVSSYPHVLPGLICDLLVKDLPSDRTTAELQAEVERGLVGGSRARGLDRALLADTGGWLPDNLLMKVDRMSMAHSLEVRVPFLDYRLVELAARIPAKMKRRDRTGKVIVREAFADRLGDTLKARGKHGFSLPIGSWLHGLMRPLAEESLSSGLEKMPWIDRSAVDEITEDLMAGRMDMWRQTWMLLTLAAWFARTG